VTAILHSEAIPPRVSGEFRLLFRLSAPVVIAQLGMMMMMMGAVDMMMVARH
jgi:Na+-driven multidrug efflux pump